MKRHTLMAMVVCGVFGVVMVGSVQAGLISIGTTALSSEGSEITTLGVLVAAWNAGGNEDDVTINGVTFSAAKPADITLDFGGGIFTDRAAAANIYSGDMLEIMEDFAYTRQTAPSYVTISGLTVGETYQVQFTHEQSDAGEGSRDMEIHFGEGAGGGAFSAVDPSITTVLFTADADSQLFKFRVGYGDRAILNSVSVTTVPEPITMALLGLGSLGLLRRSR